MFCGAVDAAAAMIVVYSLDGVETPMLDVIEKEN